MTKAKVKWMTLAELAFVVKRDGIPGFPLSDSGMLHFIRNHKIDDDPGLVTRNPEREGGWLYSARILEIYRRDDRNDWFSSGDAIKARLPSLPKSSGTFSTFVQKAKWRDVPEKARKRQWHGGGWEYHVSLLPPEDQCAWRDYVAKRDVSEEREEGDQGELPLLRSSPAAQAQEKNPEPAPSQPAAAVDLSSIRNSALLAELMTRIFRALGDDDGRGI